MFWFCHYLFLLILLLQVMMVVENEDARTNPLKTLEKPLNIDQKTRGFQDLEDPSNLIPRIGCRVRLDLCFTSCYIYHPLTLENYSDL